MGKEQITGFRGTDKLTPLLALPLFGVLIFLASLQLNDAGQIQLSIGVIVVLMLLRPLTKRRPHFTDLGRFLRIVFILLAVFVSARYLLWRTFNTLPTQDLLSFFTGLLLYLAELFAFLMMVAGTFVSLHPLRRPILPMPADRSTWPSVDVLVPTYNESDTLLETTLIGAVGIDYPPEKLKVYLLDDGSTTRKRTQPDQDRARDAQARHERLQALCAELGVGYLTREDNKAAKAGNINNALRHIQGELILTLDADHVPTRDILTNTLAWFDQDPNLFLVQSPHFFLTPDPIEKNLRTFQLMPSEQDMFFSGVQRGLDFWNASFYCGAAAVLRRRHLDEIGGLQEQTVTEDAETALALHAPGYHSAYIQTPMIAGLQPDDFVGLVKQRTRWAQGMTQLLLLRNPLGVSGLAWWQRLAYLNSMLFWLFPFARMVFLLAPLTYLIFGLGIFDATLKEILLLGIPHVLSIVILNHYLYGNVRWIFTSEFYELLLAPHLLRPIAGVLRHPHAPRFEVTEKEGIVAQDHISPLARPVYLLIAITLLGLGLGIWRYFEVPPERDTIIVTMTWASLNLVLLFGSLGVLVERQQRRTTARVLCRHRAQIRAGGRTFECETSDLSLNGVGLRLDSSAADWLREHPAEGIRLSGDGVETGWMAATCHSIQPREDAAIMGFQLLATTLPDRRAIVALAYGDSKRWSQMLRRRNRPVPMRKQVAFVWKLMFRFVPDHIRLKWRSTRLRIGESADPGRHAFHQPPEQFRTTP